MGKQTIGTTIYNSKTVGISVVRDDKQGTLVYSPQQSEKYTKMHVPTSDASENINAQRVTNSAQTGVELVVTDDARVLSTIADLCRDIQRTEGDISGCSSGGGQLPEQINYTTPEKFASRFDKEDPAMDSADDFGFNVNRGLMNSEASGEQYNAFKTQVEMATVHDGSSCQSGPNIKQKSQPAEASLLTRLQAHPVPVHPPKKIEDDIPSDIFATRGKCVDDGLIVVSRSGFLLIKVFEEQYSERTARWLGNNPKHPCIIRNIGEVSSIPYSDGLPAGLPTVWAFQPRKRIYWINWARNHFNLVGVTPTLPISIDIDVAHMWPMLGAYPDKQTHWAYNMSMGGPITTPATVRFGYSVALLFLYSYNYIWATTVGMGSSAIGKWGGPSVIQLKPTTACDELPLASNSIARFFDVINRLRVCEYGVPACGWDASTAVVCKNYAARMLAEDFFGHTDPSGKSVTDRLDAANIKYETVGEVMSKVVHDSPESVMHLTNDVIDTAFLSLRNSESHLATIIDLRFTRCGVGVSGHIDETGAHVWIFVGIFRSLEEDTTMPGGGGARISFNVKDIPHLAAETTEPNSVKSEAVPCFRALSNRPAIDIYAEGIVHSWSKVDRWGTGWPDKWHGKEYGFKATKIVEGGCTQENVVEDIPFEYDIRRSYRQLAGYSPDGVRVYLQYDTHGRSIWLAVSETGCSLHVGDCIVDSVSKHVSGNSTFEDIFVGSIYHTCPEIDYEHPESYEDKKGYTVISYGVSHSVNFTKRSWKDARHNTVFEYVYDTVLTYWAAVIDENDTLVSRFQLGGYLNKEDENNWSVATEQLDADGIQEYFMFQFGGPIKLGSVGIKYIAGGENYSVYEGADGTIPTDDNTIAVAGVDHDEGVVTITFGTPQPDNLSTIAVTALVSEIKDRYQLLEQTGKQVQYIDDNMNNTWTYGSLSLKGTYPVYPNLTLTQDGEYLVWFMKMIEVDEDAINNAPIHPPQAVSEWKASGTLWTDSNVMGQYTVFTKEGKLVAGPFFVTYNSEGSDVVVLN